MQKNILHIATTCLLLIVTVSNSYAQKNDSLIITNILENLSIASNQNTLDSTKIDTLPTELPFKIDTIGNYQIPLIDSLICYAESFLGRPYKYGSKGPESFDCSGFTGYVFSHFGFSLASSSTYQYKEAPHTFSDICQAQQGDLIFFMGRNGRKSVGHVGIVVDVDTANSTVRFIHAATHGGIIETNFPSHSYYNQRFMDFGRYNLPQFYQAYELKKTYLHEMDNSDNKSDGE